MPKRPRIRRSPTPFARILLDFMHQHYPMDQSELAELLGVAQGTMSNWLKGGKLPRSPFQTIPQIARATGIPEATLYQSIGMVMGPAPAPPRGPDAVRAPSPEEVWLSYVHHLRTMQDPRLTPEIRELMIDIANRTWTGQSAYARQIAAEHAVVEGTIVPPAEMPPASGESTQQVSGQRGEPR